MTAPEYPGGPIPEKTYTASTITQLQDIDPEDYATADNVEVHGSAELVRVVFFSSIYSLVEEIPIIGGAIGDIIEILTGVEDGDLNDLGTWVSNLGSFVNDFIAAALHALADLLDFVPIVGGALSDIIEGIAEGMNDSHETAVTAQSTATTAQASADVAYGNAGAAHALATTANTNAGSAVSAANAAANAAAAASEKADIAYAAAVEWAREFVVSSAEVSEGGGEVLVGPMLPVRAGRSAVMTDVTIALLEQYGGLTVETRIWDPTGTTYSVAHTGVIDPNVTRRTFSGLAVDVEDEERFFPYVQDIVGTVPPTVLQINVSGVYIDTPP